MSDYEEKTSGLIFRQIYSRAPILRKPQYLGKKDQDTIKKRYLYLKRRSKTMDCSKPAAVGAIDACGRDRHNRLAIYIIPALLPEVSSEIASDSPLWEQACWFLRLLGDGDHSVLIVWYGSDSAGHVRKIKQYIKHIGRILPRPLLSRLHLAVVHCDRPQTFLKADPFRAARLGERLTLFGSVSDVTLGTGVRDVPSHPLQYEKRLEEEQQAKERAKK
eukprot:gnl/Dysnectes_brevis/4445_a5980_645.p1 GENE.gnl/Dysnectes_brevis/4445_a5980_645~~gnl/Dysnectes_brevis/4445_a5980_645.p1  ORF type:complete len:218 (-),score=52.56 gnl/Dysnectes_brevis/4445_a5980_645:63-716(-)